MNMQTKYAFKIKGEDLYLSTSVDGSPCTKVSPNISVSTCLETAKNTVKKSKGLLELVSIEYSVKTKQVTYLSDVINAGLELGLNRVLVLQHNVNREHVNNSIFDMYIKAEYCTNLDNIYRTIASFLDTSLVVLPSYKKSAQEIIFMYRNLYMLADLVAIQNLDGTFDIVKNRYNNIPMHSLV